MGKHMLTETFGRKETVSIKDYVKSELSDGGSEGMIENAASNAESAQSGLALLCQILTDRGVLTAEDILMITGSFEQNYKLVEGDD